MEGGKFSTITSPSSATTEGKTAPSTCAMYRASAVTGAIIASLGPSGVSLGGDGNICADSGNPDSTSREKALLIPLATFIDSSTQRKYSARGAAASRAPFCTVFLID